MSAVATSGPNVVITVLRRIAAGWRRPANVGTPRWQRGRCGLVDAVTDGSLVVPEPVDERVDVVGDQVRLVPLECPPELSDDLGPVDLPGDTVPRVGCSRWLRVVRVGFGHAAGLYGAV